MLNEKDLDQIAETGISEKTVQRQIEYFRKGVKKVKLAAPAIPDNGIEIHTNDQIEGFVKYFDEKTDLYKTMKFVPASGAASRMFKQIYEALDFFIEHDDGIREYMHDNPLIADFFNQLENYPFFPDLRENLKNKGLKPDYIIDIGRYDLILKYLLEAEGLNYGNLPKGLLKFHVYDDHSRTPVEEHFEESARYLVCNSNKVYLHFTVSPEHQEMFRSAADKLKEKYLKEKGLEFFIEFSEQKRSTDTIAVEMDNQPLRNENGELIFRPGGHGALLHNLNDLEADIIFIGNIDNVAPDHTKPSLVTYKKYLGGFLIKKILLIHRILKKIENGDNSSQLRAESTDLIKEISPEKATAISKLTKDTFFTEVYHFLNKPVRVCGMVKNTGEPGGGPFWIEKEDGSVSKQIVETSQIDRENEEQERILNSATHFNPVDLVCYMKDFEGNKFDLLEYRDPDTGLISEKSIGGETIKALEHPGLWNGSMAKWLTWFVDVPLETFSPVKTVFDLLRPEHR